MAEAKKKKRFFAKHAKSSALVISLGVHTILLLIALTFVAVTVIIKEDQIFEAKPVNRPKMQLKKLQVPVNIKKKKTQRPKLRKRVVVQPKLNQNMPDLKMPEITGVKGGIGNAAGDGLGGAGGIGFSMPEFELFGIKGKGEKIFIILDSSAQMMVDEMGGIPAYTIIKAELVRILEGLNPTVLFNIAVFGGGERTLFPDLVSATPANVAKVEKWLDPLNAVSKGMGDKDYGVNRTIGAGGVPLKIDTQISPLKSNVGYWARPTMMAMKQQADVVFVLSCTWGFLAYKVEEVKDWNEAQMAHWKEMVAKAEKKLKEENAARRAKGQPPRVINRGSRGGPLVKAYFPNEPQPPSDKHQGYTPKEIVEAFSNMREQHKPKQIATTSGIGRKQKKDRFSINVIHFVRNDNTSGKKKNSWKSPA